MTRLCPGSLTFLVSVAAICANASAAPRVLSVAAREFALGITIDTSALGAVAGPSSMAPPTPTRRFAPLRVFVAGLTQDPTSPSRGVSGAGAIRGTTSGGPSQAKTGVIIPRFPPIVPEGSTSIFSLNVPVSWSLAPGSAGSIDADGTYYAPGSVTPKQSIAGCQVLPNNHVFNTPIRDLPVHPQSAAWIAGQPWSSLNYLDSFPINVITDSAQSQFMKFRYTPLNDGLFKYLPYPDLKVESGYFAASRFDRHVLVVEKDTCVLQEQYNMYPPNPSDSCPTCTSAGGVRYSSLDYNLPANGATDAASLFLIPLLYREDEFKRGAINHALRVTVPHPSTDPAISPMWPALATAGNGGSLPMGARIRLRDSFALDSANPYTHVLITQLKEYGLFVSDTTGMDTWDITGVDDIRTPDIRAAMNEVRNAIAKSDFEVVDESSLRITDPAELAAAGCLNASVCGAAKGTGTIVIATRKSNPAEVASRQVILTGPAVGVQSAREFIQANTGPKQLTGWVNGAMDTGLNWSLEPPVGSVTANGVYTPPAFVDSPTTTTVVATSNADPSARASVTITILPAGTLRINAGGGAYTDSAGQAWLADVAADGLLTWGYGGTWTGTPDPALYSTVRVSGSDLGYYISMPNGNYRITAKFGEGSYDSLDQRIMHLEAQGQVVYRNVDVYAAAGGKYKAVDFELPAVVTDGKLRFVLRHVNGEQTFIAALQVAPDPGTPRITINPPNGGSVFPMGTAQFNVVRWYLSGGVTWSISPQVGSIGPDGLYTGPATKMSQDTVVTVTARSVNNPSLTATAQLTVLGGFQTIRVSCAATSPFTDAQGRLWAADYGFGGVSTSWWPDPTPRIANTTPDMYPLYGKARYAHGAERFWYSFAVPNGNYSVVLKFADYYQNPSYPTNQDILINGVKVLAHFNVDQAAGGNLRAYDRTFTATVTAGILRIDFQGYGEAYLGAWINGIEIASVGSP